jgi:hypothetical protein
VPNTKPLPAETKASIEEAQPLLGGFQPIETKAATVEPIRERDTTAPSASRTALAMSDWEASEFASIWASAGVYVGDEPGYHRCPRGCCFDPLWIDPSTGAYVCRTCRLMGRGLRSLQRVVDLLFVPVVEKEKLLWDVFDELGHCPRARQRAFIRGSQLKILVTMCNRHDCGYCRTFWFRECYGHYARRLHGPRADCQPIYWATIPETKVATATKMVTRKNGDYLRVPVDADKAHIYATAPFMRNQQAQPHTRWDDTLWDILAWDLSEAHTTGRKITSSRRWSRDRAKQEAAQFDPAAPDDDAWEPVSFMGDWRDLIEDAAERGLMDEEAAMIVKQTYWIDLDRDPGAAVQYKEAHKIVPWAYLNERMKPNWTPPGAPR